MRSQGRRPKAHAGDSEIRNEQQPIGSDLSGIESGGPGKTVRACLLRRWPAQTPSQGDLHGVMGQLLRSFVGCGPDTFQTCS